MKKILILLIMLLMFTACTNGDEPETPVKDNPEVKEEINFPFEELEGYWVSQSGNGYFLVYKNDANEYSFKEGDFDGFETGEIDIRSIEKMGDTKYYFETKYIDMNGLIGNKVIDIKELEMSYIQIEEDKYVFVGFDEYQAKLAHKARLFALYYDKLIGIWNGDDTNDFVSFFIQDDEFMLAPGLYDSDGFGSLAIHSYIWVEGAKYEVAAHSNQNADFLFEFELDLKDIDNDKIIYNGVSMHFGGTDFNSAYEEYAKRFH